jgi:hypothetical protein
VTEETGIPLSGGSVSPSMPRLNTLKKALLPEEITGPRADLVTAGSCKTA